MEGGGWGAADKSQKGKTLQGCLSNGDYRICKCVGRPNFLAAWWVGYGISSLRTNKWRNIKMETTVYSVQRLDMQLDSFTFSYNTTHPPQT